MSKKFKIVTTSPRSKKPRLEANRVFDKLSEITTSTVSSNVTEVTGLDLNTLRDVMKKMKNIDPLVKMSMSQKTWDNMPRKDGNIAPDMPLGVTFSIGTPVTVSNMIPDGFFFNEYKSGRTTLFNLKTGREVTIIEGRK